VEFREFWEYNEHNIDGKGRLVLPSSFREAFADGGVLTFQGTHAALHTPSGWDRARRALEDDTRFTKAEQAWVKSLVCPVVPDAQNRVMLPARLRAEVGLDKEVSLVGMGGHVAIYSTEAWHALEARLRGGDEHRPPLNDRLAELL